MTTYELSNKGEELRKKWERKLLDKIGNYDNFTGTYVLDNSDYIQTIDDECGWLLLTYSVYAVDTLDEWGNEYGYDDACCGGFTIQQVKDVMLRNYLVAGQTV